MIKFGFENNTTMQLKREMEGKNGNKNNNAGFPTSNSSLKYEI
jgi:hypothetical protein